MSSDGGARTAGSKRKAREDPSETAPEKKYRAGTDESASAAAPPEESLSSADKGAAETRAELGRLLPQQRFALLLDCPPSGGCREGGALRFVAHRESEDWSSAHCRTLLLQH